MNTTTAARTRSRSVRSILLAGAILAPVGLGGCGDDEGASAEYEDFCAANLEIDRATFDGDDAEVEAAMTSILDASPNDDTRGKVQATIDAFMELQGPPGPEFNEVYGELIAVVDDECGFQDLAVEAKDYEFSGVDGSLDAGPTLITFDNEGNEFHEFMIMRRTDGDDTPVSELLSMEEDEAMSHVEPVAGAFAAPGATGHTSIDLQPGKYVAVCFIPQGATQEAWDEMMAGGPEPDGDPHAMHGMTAEFEVKA